MESTVGGFDPGDKCGKTRKEYKNLLTSLCGCAWKTELLHLHLT